MAARTCSRAVTQTARKGAHQGAARRQARKMLRQVSEPTKNKISSLMACHMAPYRHLPCHPYRMSTPGNGCRARTQYRGNGCPGLYSRRPKQTTGTAVRSLVPGRPIPCSPSCASFLPWKDMLSLSFPRLAGKPILVLWLCLRTSSLPVLTGMSNHPALVSVAGWTGLPPVSGKKGFSVKRQSVQHTNRLRNKNREEPQPLPVRTVSFCAGTSVRPALFAIPG